MEAKLIEHINGIENILFYYEVIESIPFSELNTNTKVYNLVIDVIDFKLREMLGEEVYNEYCEAIV